MNLFKLSWKNVIYRPLSSGLSILLLSSGISIILVALLTYTQINDKFTKNGNQVDLVIGAKGSRLQLVLCNMFHVDNPTGNINYARTGFLKMHPFVEKAIPLSLGDNYETYRIVGTTIDYIDLYEGELDKGEMWSEPLQVVIGSGIAKKLKLKIGSTFVGGHGIGESTHHHDEFAYTVVGILKQNNTVLDNLLLTDIKSPWIVHSAHGHESEGSFDVKTKEQHDAEAQSLDSTETETQPVSIAQITTIEEEHEHDHSHHDHGAHEKINFDEVLKTIDPKTREITSVLVTYKTARGKFTIPGIANNMEGMMAAEPAIEIQQLFQLIEPALGVMEVMALFIMIIAAISMFVSMVNSLKDRKYEIALMRVMGASSSMVFIVILLEGIFLAVLGYIVGIFISHIGMELLSGYLANMYHYDFTGWVWLNEEWLLLFGAIVIGMVSAMYPAFKAYRTDISKTLSK